MVLVGPSGCGKSTLLRMIAGLEEVTTRAASTSATGTSPTQLPQQRDVAMVFQSYALYPRMSVRRNMGFGLRMRRTPRAERDRRVAEVAKTSSGSEHLLDRRPGRALRRPAPAGGHGPGDRARAAGVPHGRAAVQPRRQAAGEHARPALAAAPAARGHDRLRHPRPDRGHDARPAGGRAARRRAAAVRHAAGPVPPPRQPVRRRLHRVAVDELRPRQGRRRHQPLRRRDDPAPGRFVARRREPAGDPGGAADRPSRRDRQRVAGPAASCPRSSRTWATSAT